VKRLAKRFGCPVELSLELLGGKWKPVILARLKERPHRYSELRKLIPNLSTKMLSQRLRDLEVRGLVERRGGVGGKPHAVYRLTARADVGGVVIVFECKDVAEVQQYIADFPLTKAGLIEWQYIPLGSPLPLEFLFDPTIDVAEPFDRTKGAGKLEASAT